MQEASKPYVGLMVDFYPNNFNRYPALIIEVYPSENDAERPKVNLKCFKPNGEDEVWTEVPPVEIPVDSADLDLTECWGYAHEYLLDQEPDQENFGTTTNDHVGQVSEIF